MPEEKNEELRDLLRVERPVEASSRSVEKAAARVRAGVGARDAILFAVVRIWTVVMRLLAPVFAALAVRKAEVDAARGTSRDSHPRSD